MSVDSTEPRLSRNVSTRVILKLNLLLVVGRNDKKNKLFFCMNEEKNEFFLANWNGFVERVPFNVK